MSREEQIIEASRNTIFKTGLIRFDDISFIEGAKWADKTILQEVLEWLKEHCWRRETTASFLMQEDPPSYEIVMNFESDEELCQSFKERFNIE